ncbi:MAG: hypothetical protein M3P26_10505 [Gemmatimonadota bacterium]|nr:hypothetical protein [Gemmatimonadota bacterium]
MSESATVRCMLCREFVPRKDTESIRHGDICGLVCKSHEAVSFWDGKEQEARRRASPDMSEIHNCVICGRDLRAERIHVDTCSKPCFQKQLRRQRELAES